MDGARLLRYTAPAFLAGWALHTADHVRRGFGHSPAAVVWGGNAGLAAAALVTVLVLGGHRLAPQLAVVYGFGSAIVVAAAHLPPHWGFLSEPFRSEVDALSWATLVLALACSLAFGAAGARVLLASSPRRTSTNERGVAWSR